MKCGPNLIRVLWASFALVIGCGGEPTGGVGSSFLPSDGGVGSVEAVDGRTGTVDPLSPGETPPPGEETPPPSDETPPPGEETPPPAENPPPATGELSVASLGTLPSELSGLTWPERPRITREVTVTSAAALNAEATPGTRIRVVGASGGDVSIHADDIEIIADAASSLGHVSIAKGTSRVRIEGGRWTGFLLPIPADWAAGQYSADWMAEDIWIEGVTVTSSDIALEVRGRRIAIARSHVTAARYSVWCGDTGPLQTQDLILYDNVFDSAGPEATVRFVSVLRSATVSNVLVNTFKHNYRVHGVSDLAYAADNLLVNTGVMLGRMAGDSLNRIWFDDNVLHQTAPDLFNPDAAIQSLRARRNVAYDNGHTTFYGATTNGGWDVSDNQLLPYTAPPPY